VILHDRAEYLRPESSLSMRVGTVKCRLNPHDRRSCWRLRPTGDPG
jgi:hypothetical protein